MSFAPPVYGGPSTSNTPRLPAIQRAASINSVAGTPRLPPSLQPIPGSLEFYQKLTQTAVKWKNKPLPGSQSARLSGEVSPDEARLEANRERLRVRREVSQKLLITVKTEEEEAKKVMRRQRAEEARRKRSAATTVQASVRGRAARREVTRQLSDIEAQKHGNAASRLQARHRGNLERRKLVVAEEENLDRMKERALSILHENDCFLQAYLQRALYKLDEDDGLVKARKSSGSDGFGFMLPMWEESLVLMAPSPPPKPPPAGVARSPRRNSRGDDRRRAASKLQARHRGNLDRRRLSSTTSAASASTSFDPMLDDLRDALLSNLPRVIDVFREFDQNGDGKVSRHEFGLVLPMMLYGDLGTITDAQLNLLFDGIDKDKSGTVELKELNKLLRSGNDVRLSNELQPGGAGTIEMQSKNKIALRNGKQQPPKALTKGASVEELQSELTNNLTRVIDLFRIFDRNGDGNVSASEFRAALPLLGYDASCLPLIDQIFQRIDADSSGSITYDELRRSLRTVPKEVQLAPELQPGAVGVIETESKNAISLRDDRSFAASRLQARHRGNLDRRKLRPPPPPPLAPELLPGAMGEIETVSLNPIALRETNERGDAASRLQARHRGNLDRRRLDERRDSATRLQAQYRGTLVRGRLIQEMETEAASILQARHRGNLDRRKLRRPPPAPTAGAKSVLPPPQASPTPTSPQSPRKIEQQLPAVFGGMASPKKTGARSRRGSHSHDTANSGENIKE